MFTWYTSLVENCQVLLTAYCAVFSCHCSVTAFHSQLDSRTTYLSTMQRRFLMLFGAGKQKMRLISKETKQEQLVFKRKDCSLPGVIHTGSFALPSQQELAESFCFEQCNRTGPREHYLKACAAQVKLLPKQSLCWLPLRQAVCM